MWSEEPVRGGSLPSKTLSLTFDDGPGCPYVDGSDSRTLELAHYLAEEGIQATFFIVGQHLMEHPGLLQKLVGWGHLVGNHSFSHLRLTTSFASDAEIVREVRTTSDLLLSAVDDLPILFRPPFGGWTPRLAHVLNSNPFTCLNLTGPVNWDICGRDYAHWRDGLSPETCAQSYHRAIGKRREKNGIVLFHDRTADDAHISRRNRAPELMRILVPRLRSEGLSFTGLKNVPELRRRMRGGVECSLRASNGRYLSVRDADDEDCRASATTVGARQRFTLFTPGPGAARIESADGRVLWANLRLDYLAGQSVALQTAGGPYLSWNSADSRVEARSKEVNPTSSFRFGYLREAPCAVPQEADDRRQRRTDLHPLLRRFLAPR